MKRIMFVLLAAILILTACGPSAAPMNYAEPAYGVGGGDADQQGFAPPAPTMSPMEAPRAAIDPATGKVEASPRERLVIKNADLAIVVKDPEAAMTAIAKLAETMGGFVVSSNLYQSYTPSGIPVPEASIVVRVPSEKLDEALTKIKADATEVQTENISGQDVTSAYVDLESQLKNLEAAEAQLMEIMKKAEKTEDVLNVFNQLTSIRGQIEVIKGQMKYYEESAALSSVSVRLIAEETIKPIVVGGWKPAGTLQEALQNLVNFSQDFVDFLIWFVVNFLPKLLMVGVVFGLPIWLIVRAVRNASRRRKARAEAEASKEVK